MTRDVERVLASRRTITGPARRAAHGDDDGCARVLVVEGPDGIDGLIEQAVTAAVGDQARVVRPSGPAPSDGVAVLVSRLSDDDLRLWHLVASGCYDAEIASELYVSERTVKRRVAALLQLLGVQRRIEAATLAGRVGLGHVA